MELLAPLAGAIASGLCFWLMTRSGRKQQQAIIDEILRGPSITVTLKGDGTTEVKHNPGE